MIKPKHFYRELDAMLDQIGHQKSDKNFFVKILTELERKFSDALYIKETHIYEQRGNEFVLINSSHSKTGEAIAKSIDKENEAVRQIIKSGRVIFEDSDVIDHFQLDSHHTTATLAAISVHNPVRRWLFIFELKAGWSRDQMILFLRAMRTALNYRLFSEMIGDDLERAEQIQKSLLPNMAPKIPGYDIAGHSQPAEIVGGDFFEYFQFDDELDFGISIGDASGHGMPAALLVRDVVIGLRMGWAKEMRLVHTVKKLNEVIQRSTISTNFISLFVGEIEDDGHLFYVNAGHPPPFLISGDRITELEATGITLGFVQNIDLRRAYVKMEPGSILVLYSDGIVERGMIEEEQYGLDQLKNIIIKNKDKSAEEIVKLVFKSVFDFGKRKTWEDDATLVVIKRLNGNITTSSS